MAAPKNPAGAKSDKLWRDAIMRAVRRVESKESPQALDRLADKVVALGLEGDMSALKEIGDRLDGRPVQAVEVGRPGDFDHLSDDAVFNEYSALQREIRASGPARPRGKAASKPERLH